MSQQNTSVPDKEEILLKAWQKLQASSPIAVYCPIIHITGSFKSAIFLSQLLYWTQKGVTINKNDGWVFKKTREITDETGLTKCEQDTIKSSLEALGLLEYSRTRLGMDSGLKFRVNLQKLGTEVAKFLQVDLMNHELNISTLRNPVFHRKLFSQRVAYHRDLVYLTKDINAAAMLSFAFRQIVRNYGEYKIPFVTISIQDWQKVIGLSWFEQHRARHKLIGLGILSEKHLEASRRIFYFLDGAVLLKFFSKQMPSILSKQKSNAITSKKNLRNSQFAGYHTSESGFSHIEHNQGVTGINYLCNPDSRKLEIRNDENLEYADSNTENTDSVKLGIVNKNLDYSSKDYSLKDYTYPSVGGGAQFIENETQPSIHIDQIHWPRQLTMPERKTAVDMLQRLLVNKMPHTIQTLLDEVAGTPNLRSALGLLRRLILNQNENIFFPTHAYKISTARASQAAIKQKILDAERSLHKQQAGSDKTEQVNGANSEKVRRDSIAALRKHLNMKT